MLRRWWSRLWGEKGPAEAAVPPGRGDAPPDEDEPPFDPERAMEIPIEDFIDLHTFSPKETASVVEEYLPLAHAKGFREVRIIHGKGKGVQRRIIQSVLARHPLVASFADAPRERGGWGATLAWLREEMDERGG